MSKRKGNAEAPVDLKDWLQEQSSKEKRTCVICEKYGPGTPEGEALEQYLSMTTEQRYGMAFYTFVRTYLHKRLHATGAGTTWKDHVTRCLGRGGAI